MGAIVRRVDNEHTQVRDEEVDRDDIYVCTVVEYAIAYDVVDVVVVDEDVAFVVDDDDVLFVHGARVD